MNKFIETDLHNGKHYIYCALMNVISELENGHLTKYDFGKSVPYSMLREALEERSWKEEDDMETNGWELDFWVTWRSPADRLFQVCGCFILGGLKIELNNETD